MAHPDLISRPPILVDVGASAGLPVDWKLIAPYSICIAFDADTRDFSISESESKGYKKLYLLNRLVASKTKDSTSFFLTRSPHCSSSLKPDENSIKSWAFNKMFDIENIVDMPADTLTNLLITIGVDYVDWFKIDSQGTDLRIFKSLPLNIIEKIIVAEFEPGIINAYIGEDKLHQLMNYMDKKPFWISSMKIKGSQRIDQDDLIDLNILQSKSIDSFLKMAPGWCEISYINNLENDNLSRRDLLLSWVFSTIKEEHGFALRAAKIGLIKFNEKLFNELINSSKKSLSSGYIKLGRKIINKIGGIIIGNRL